MSDDSFTTGKCAECGQRLSMEVGITNYGHEGGGKLYCTPCSPGQGKGVTLADIERGAWDKMLRDRELRIMEQLGPDVYFFVADAPPNADGADLT